MAITYERYPWSENSDDYQNKALAENPKYRVEIVDGRKYTFTIPGSEVVVGRKTWQDQKTDPVYEKWAVGCVVTTRERNGYDDSDFYAIYWDPEAKRLNEVEYATTRFATDGNSAYADAKDGPYWDEIQAWLRNFNVKQIREAEIARWQQEAYYSCLPQKGAKVKVVKGRKVPKGTEGIVFWTGERQRYGWDFYHGSHDSNVPGRIGFKDAKDNTWWTDAGNVEVLIEDPEDVVPPFTPKSDAEVIAMADRAGLGYYLGIGTVCGGFAVL
jgi:hypothetical protein